MRWLLVPLGAACGVLIAAVTTAILYAGLASWCPFGYNTTGVCSDSWVNNFPFYFGGATAAATSISLGTLLAPSHHRAVAWGLYGIGLCIALVFARHEMLWAAFTAAVVGMGMTTFLHGKYREIDS